jgi:phage-related protein
MRTFQAVYYRAPDGSEPVNDFIDRLSIKRQVVLDKQISRLNMLTPDDPHLPFPHSSQLEGELRELRCHYGRELYRVLYRRSRSLFVLLHMFRKDTGAIPKLEIRVAQGDGLTSRLAWMPKGAGRPVPWATMPHEARRDIAGPYQKW